MAISRGHFHCERGDTKIYSSALTKKRLRRKLFFYFSAEKAIKFPFECVYLLALKQDRKNLCAGLCWLNPLRILSENNIGEPNLKVFCEFYTLVVLYHPLRQCLRPGNGLFRMQISLPKLFFFILFRTNVRPARPSYQVKFKRKLQ